MSDRFTHIYFLGIGGIGMSALARYFAHFGYRVSGYDRTPSSITQSLTGEGIAIIYDGEDSDSAYIDSLSSEWQRSNTLVVYTPAVPSNEPLYQWFSQHGYTMVKRAEVLGMITRQEVRIGTVSEPMKALCVAGTHGKTSTSTMLAHLMHESEKGCNAFLGGISQNYHSNLLLDSQSGYVVVEADEFDRSFHHLTPFMSVITGIEPDHLDIYGTAEAYQQAFDHYASLVSNTLVVKKGFEVSGAHCRVYHYSSQQKADFYADNIRLTDGHIYFDFHTPADTYSDMVLSIPVLYNVDNAVAALSVAWLNGIEESKLRTGLQTYAGVWRRFNILFRNEQIVYIDDYAHHPTEIQSSLAAVRYAYPHHRLLAVFQPHLFTRTRDFMSDFASSLSLADEVLLLPIYPAREQPIEGVTAEALAQQFTGKVQVISKEQLCSAVIDRISRTAEPTVVLTLGAGDIDRLVPTLQQRLQQL
ncbi:MAG: UDP-N-acetylmuramate--L-alanine ligase [Paludibacteraceae bacterium]|nr:UDP-N-acetylmuramate--L-alanine ligase [Paludibacteraceae bacterium]